MSADLIADFCAEYHDYHAISAGRRTMQLRVLRELEASLGHDVDELEAAELESYLASLISRGLKPSTVRRNLMAIRPFLKWLWKKERITAEGLMKLRDVEPPRGGNGNGRPNPYRRDDIKRFWREFDQAYPPAADPEKWLRRFREGHSRYPRVMPHAKRTQLRAVVALTLMGGLRRDEAYGQAIVDMHYENAYVVVKGARKNAEAEVRVREVPWTTPEMREWIREWIDLREVLAPPHDFAWLSLHQERHALKPMRHRQFEMLVRNIGRGWEYRRFRHTAATEMLRAGYELHEVQRILGHSRIQQTLGYAELLPDDIVRSAVRHAPQLSGALLPPV